METHKYIFKNLEVIELIRKSQQPTYLLQLCGAYLQYTKFVLCFTMPNLVNPMFCRNHCRCPNPPFALYSSVMLQIKNCQLSERKHTHSLCHPSASNPRSDNLLCNTMKTNLNSSTVVVTREYHNKWLQLVYRSPKLTTVQSNDAQGLTRREIQNEKTDGGLPPLKMGWGPSTQTAN